MKSIFVIFLILFFTVIPVNAQLLSDTTGLINRFEVETSGHTFEIKLTSNFDLNDFIFDKEQKQLTLYSQSSLDNNLAEVIIPKSLLSGNFTFYLNDQEFFPKIQSNDKINFITLNFTGSGDNVVKIRSTEYLFGLTEIVPIEISTNEISTNEISTNEISTNEITFNDSFIWFTVGGILVTIVVFVGIKILKNKN